MGEEEGGWKRMGRYPDEYGRISRADICIDDNCSVTRILRRLLMGEICFAHCLRAIWPISNLLKPLHIVPTADCANVSVHQTAMSPRKCDASTIQYPSQLSVSNSTPEMILRITERGALDRLIDIHFVVYDRR